MATRSVQPAPAAWPAPVRYTIDEVNEHTDRRIRAYLASVRPERGSDLGANDEYERGRAAIERLALSAHDTGDPTLQLSETQGADVLYFVRCSEPLEERTWWQDPKSGPSHLVGWTFVARGGRAQPASEGAVMSAGGTPTLAVTTYAGSAHCFKDDNGRPIASTPAPRPVRSVAARSSFSWHPGCPAHRARCITSCVSGASLRRPERQDAA